MGSNKTQCKSSVLSKNRVGDQKRPPMNKKLLRTGSLRSRDEACKITKMMKYWIFCPQFRALSVKLGISVSRFLGISSLTDLSSPSSFPRENGRRFIGSTSAPTEKKSNFADFPIYFPAPFTPSDFFAFFSKCKNNVVSVEIELSLIS